MEDPRLDSRSGPVHVYCEERRDSIYPKVADDSSEQVDGLLGGECWVEWEHTFAIQGIPRDCRAVGLAERERWSRLRMLGGVVGRQWSEGRQSLEFIEPGHCAP